MLTQAVLSVFVCDHHRAIAAAWTALNVKISKEQSQHAPLWYTKPPLTPGVTGVGTRIVLGGYGARLWCQQRMSTAITWHKTSTIRKLRQEKKGTVHTVKIKINF